MALNNNKNVWKSMIPAEDLDKHMISTKQVKANAKILQNMLKDFPIKKGSKILIPGCGTGQIFDYLDGNLFFNSFLTFTDINLEYLDKLKQRLQRLKILYCEIIEDDIETAKIQKKFDSSILILVLEHVNWKKSLKNILNLGCDSFYIIIQSQDKNKENITFYENTPKSIIEFSKTAKTHLIREDELNSFLKKKGFNLLKKYKQKTLNNKTMQGLYFKKQE